MQLISSYLHSYIRHPQQRQADAAHLQAKTLRDRIRRLPPHEVSLRSCVPVPTTTNQMRRTPTANRKVKVLVCGRWHGTAPPCAHIHCVHTRARLRPLRPLRNLLLLPGLGFLVRPRGCTYWCLPGPRPLVGAYSGPWFCSKVNSGRGDLGWYNSIDVPINKNSIK